MRRAGPTGGRRPPPRPRGSPTRPGVPRARRRHTTAARYAAPAAFLLAVTVAAFLIRAGLHGRGSPTTTEHVPVTHPSAATTSTRRGTTTATGRFYTVESGDTFGS